ncbi:glycerophosphoryl diester phosphodiesterase [Kushneria sinocarnis]|uniref:Glycerophosphoryl diester phosphodiesterase n=1 Tax=Kushneria sinocarnis TaxID=595502 RepID=A0A420WZP6_9GAMM|nr:glycerophosphodiester phosphodiesterase [Kushneria sinocarnis]RKR06811.1 glycerophosphoryl diester phosphodiesterase [Kushneria sinocarnis]
MVIIRTVLQRIMAAVIVFGLLISAASGDAPASDQAAIGHQLSEQAGIPWHAVIAHRGDSYDAPESTRPAYLLARALGADYLELDLQRTRDGHLIAFHDDTLERTTNVAEVFPERADAPVSSFTLAELKRLDAGSWFNERYPERARPSYRGLKILTLDEVRRIAEGGDNHPGLYIETKVPGQFPGIEADLKAYLEAHHWIGDQVRQPPEGFDRNRHIGVAFTPGRVVLQTFEKSSLINLQQQMPGVPKILLLWLGEGSIPADESIRQREGESLADFRARQRVASRQAYADWLDFASAHGAVGVGPSAVQSAHDDAFSSRFSYMDLARRWMVGMSHDKGLLVHLYTVDQAQDFRTYSDRGVDGFFTNHAPALLTFYGRAPDRSVEHVLRSWNY